VDYRAWCSHQRSARLTQYPCHVARVLIFAATAGAKRSTRILYD